MKKSVEEANSASYNTPVVMNFVYDGWNLLAELDAGNNNAVVCSYTWGADLSGSLQGMGSGTGLPKISDLKPDCEFRACRSKAKP